MNKAKNVLKNEKESCIMRKKAMCWSEATTDVNEALAGLISAINAGKNAWIEIRKNDEHDYPIRIPNPVLDDWRKWTSSYGVIRNEEEMKNHNYLNDTEKDLTYNYTACFGDESAVKRYFETGILSEDNLKNSGICHPVKIADIFAFFPNSQKTNHFWVTFWKPKNNIPWLINADIDKVFAVCYNDEPVNEKFSIEKARKFLLEEASSL